jgi:isocitrate dehydrogenase kinase/phosphatase
MRCAIWPRATCFPGDLLLKNFGVTSHGRVIFYDYDEICLVSTACSATCRRPPARKRKPAANRGSTTDPRDVFPEQWLPFLSMWRGQQAHAAEGNRFMLPTMPASPVA